MMYKREDLEVKYRSQLYWMARDLNLEISSKTKKGELIEKILEVEEEDLPPMSVRVRRIYESSKGE